MRNDDWIDRFTQYLRIEKGLSRNTLSAYWRDLTLHAEYLRERDLIQVGPDIVSGFIAYMYDQGRQARSATSFSR